MAWAFDGTGDWIGNVGATPVTDLTTGVTMSCWCRPTVAQNGCLVNLSTQAGSDAIRLLYQSSGRVRAQSVNSGTGTAAETTATVSTNTWGHVAGVFSNASRSVFLDGANKVTDTGSSAASSLSRTHIGSRRNSSTNDVFFGGQIAEVGVWNTSLTDAEIASLGKGVGCSLVRPQNLVFWAPLIRESCDFSKSAIAFANITGNAAVSSGIQPRIYK